MNDDLKSLIQQFMPFAKEKMGFSRPPRLFLRQDPQNAADPLGKTGFYDPQNESITLYITGRHPKDIMRSLAHELMHHTQKCNGEFENVLNIGEEGYAQADPHMRTMEIQAYQASIVFRDWEDSCKGTIYYEHLQKGDKSSMSTKKWKNEELKSLLSEAWGFKMDLRKLNENMQGNCARGQIDHPMQGCVDDPDYDPDSSKKKVEEEPIEEYATKPKDDDKKSDDALEEMGCPAAEADEDIIDPAGEMMADMGEQDIQTLADKAMDAMQALVAAVGAEEMPTAVMAMDDEEMMAESEMHAIVREVIKELTEGN